MRRKVKDFKDGKSVRSTQTLSYMSLVNDYGFKLGIGGVLTFKNSGLDKQIKNIGLEHIILETDAPYLAPVPYRGKRNQPVYIPLIAQKLADIKGISIDEIAEITTRNAKELFNL